MYVCDRTTGASRSHSKKGHRSETPHHRPPLYYNWPGLDSAARQKTRQKTQTPDSPVQKPSPLGAAGGIRYHHDRVPSETKHLLFLFSRFFVESGFRLNDYLWGAYARQLIQDTTTYQILSRSHANPKCRQTHKGLFAGKTRRKELFSVVQQ